MSTPPPAARPISDPRQIALIIYILMLVPIVIPITHIVGLVMAYVSRDTAPDWLETHYTYQIRTFWIGRLVHRAVRARPLTPDARGGLSDA
jgi:uncharacterized membrane protein